MSYLEYGWSVNSVLSVSSYTHVKLSKLYNAVPSGHPLGVLDGGKI